MEGMDGSGKTTQVERLCARLAQEGIPFLRTREPGGSPIGDAIRELLLDPQSEMTPLTEVYLYAAGRAEHVQTVIQPAIAAGRVVVCDRFVEASIAYQGYGLSNLGMSPDIVRAVNAHALAHTTPARTFIIDVPVSEAQARLARSERLTYGGQDRIERRGAAFFERVRAGLKAIHQAEPERVVWLDGMSSPDEIAERIWGSLAQLLV